jgi:hypothetical protein
LAPAIRGHLTAGNRVLPVDAPRAQYFPRREKKSVRYNNQRKLLLSEMEFLMTYAEQGDLVLYRGTSSVKRIHYLSTLFPHVKFLIVDSATAMHQSAHNVEYLSVQFNASIANAYSTMNVLFICDMSAKVDLDCNFESVETFNKSDMDEQMKFHLTLKPKKSLLRFRLPFSPGQTEYLDGTLYLPVYGRPSTTETRLVPYGTETKVYDHTKYEEQMFYFNTDNRVSYYHMECDTWVTGHDNCYDCASAAFIVSRYLLSTLSDANSNEIAIKTAEMMKNITHILSNY